MLVSLFIMVGGYLLGSIPFGLFIVHLATGKDVRTVASGRTGGTNVARAAGFFAGLATGVLDCLKGAASVWLARWALPGVPLIHILAPLMAVIGHNYSIFLLERKPEGKLRLRGGAGGAPAAGGAFGLWPPALLFIIPVAAFFLFVIGYASLTTLSIGLTITIVFAVRASAGLVPWEYFYYGLLAEALLAIALIPNIKRLLNGNERVVGWRARYQHKKETADRKL